MSLKKIQQQKYFQFMVLDDQYSAKQLCSNNYKLIDFKKWPGCEVQQGISLGSVKKISLQTYHHRPIQKVLKIRNAHF